jgi:predicted nucleic acid-binding protein
MSDKVYVDTNIIMDYLLNRHKSDFFLQVLKCKYKVVISNLVLKELAYQNVDPSTFLSWLAYANKYECINLDKNIYSFAKQFVLNSEFNDAIHIAAAILSNADVILTRNIKDFSLSPIPVKHPDVL